MARKNLEEIIETITNFYLGGGFNGVHINELQRRIGEKVTPSKVKKFILSGKIEVHFGYWGHPNPHVKALELGDTSSQLKQFEEIKTKHDFNESVFYPTQDHLKAVVDPADYEGKPYTYELALGEPQLHVRHFQPNILIPYRDDPRYYYQFQGSAGTVFLAAEDSGISEDDQVFLKSFGTGFHKDYDGNYKTTIMCFIYDLAQLTPAQQMQWKVKEIPNGNKEYKIDHAFAQSQIFGSWDFDATMYEAFIAELRIINQMAVAVTGIPMFKKGFEKYENAPRNFHRLLIPTKKEFHNFVETLDKLMSDNLNPKFFATFFPTTETVTLTDGSTKTQSIGTIQLLETFFKSQMKFKDTDPIDVMLKAFRDVRRIRSKSSHNTVDDKYDYKFNKDQQKIMYKAYSAIRLIRLALTNHPKAKGVDVPSWLYQGDIFPR